MVDTTVPYQIVIFTQDHSISGGVFLHNQRLSDLLNDTRDSNMMLRNASVARLDNPAKVLEKTQVTFIPKSGIVLAFEPPQPVPQPSSPRYIKYPKERYDIFMNNFRDHTWTIVPVEMAIKELMETYVKYPPRKLQSMGYDGPIELSKYQKFQYIREALKTEGVNIPMPTGN